MEETGRSRRCTAEAQCDRPLSYGQLTFMVAPAAEGKVGLMVVSVNSPVRADRQQPLHG